MNDSDADQFYTAQEAVARLVRVAEQHQLLAGHSIDAGPLVAVLLLELARLEEEGKIIEGSEYEFEYWAQLYQRQEAGHGETGEPAF